MADLTGVQASQSVKIAGANAATGVEDNYADASVNGDLFARDVLNTAGQYRAQSVTTTAAEALAAGTILANRKMLSITPTNGTVFWGFDASVTITTGTPIFKNQTFVIAATDLVHIYVICASGTVDCRITAGS